jgi:hypothetical protein
MSNEPMMIDDPSAGLELPQLEIMLFEYKGRTKAQIIRQLQLQGINVYAATCAERTTEANSLGKRPTYGISVLNEYVLLSTVSGSYFDETELKPEDFAEMESQFRAVTEVVGASAAKKVFHARGVRHPLTNRLGLDLI